MTIIILMYLVCGILWGLYFTNKMVAIDHADEFKFEDLAEGGKGVIAMAKTLVYIIGVAIVAPIWPYVIINVTLKKLLNK